MSDDVRAAAEAEAKRTYEAFILWSKRTIYVIIACLLLVIVGCNNGVDGTGSGYNGEQYDPTI